MPKNRHISPLVSSKEDRQGDKTSDRERKEERGDREEVKFREPPPAESSNSLDGEVQWSQEAEFRQGVIEYDVQVPGPSHINLTSTQRTAASSPPILSNCSSINPSSSDVSGVSLLNSLRDISLATNSEQLDLSLRISHLSVRPKSV